LSWNHIECPFESEDLNKSIRDWFREVTGPPGFWRSLPQDPRKLVPNIDLRQNGGGSSNIGFTLLRYLLLEPALGQRKVERSYHPNDRARGEELIGTLERPGFPNQAASPDTFSYAPATEAATFLKCPAGRAKLGALVQTNANHCVIELGVEFIGQFVRES
jgi:hypothetical protein